LHIGEVVRALGAVPMTANQLTATRARVLAGLDEIETPQDVIAAVTRLAIAGALRLPLPGSGQTATRFRALSEIAAVDLSMARIAEGHLDAIAIAAEARYPARDGLYGVWAADAPDAKVEAEPVTGGWRLRGRKRYCSGARGLDRALVTASAGDGGRLFDLDLRQGGVVPILDTWQAVGMAATESVDVTFDIEVPDEAVVGPPAFYLERPGFWHGAVGVAACWYGGALGAARTLRAQLAHGQPTEHQLAHLGAIAATCETMQAALDGAAREIDGDASAGAAGRVRALRVRHVVEQGCQEALVRVGRAGGTSLLAFDRAHARRAADLIVYLRQHHAEPDLAALGRAVLETAPWS
jgi:alkylation response protein AidB-like acyl-CoA dehydrogenase